MTRAYSVFLHLEVTEALQSLDQPDRDAAVRFLRSLANNPFQAGDFQENDVQGRANEVKIVGRLAVIYYVDNADSEVRILEVRRTD